jgi:hypothetical protein
MPRRVSRKSQRKSQRVSRKSQRKSQRVSRKSERKSMRRSPSSRKSRKSGKKRLTAYNLFVKKYMAKLPSDMEQKEKMKEIGRMWRTYGDRSSNSHSSSGHSSLRRSSPRLGGVTLL